MTDIAERKIERYRRQFDEAAETMQKAIAEASLRAATHVVIVETAAASEQAVRAEVKAQGVVRQVVDVSGRVAGSVLRSSLQDPFAVEAFEAAVVSVSRLLLTAWQARGGVR
jgi:hypothetical protein